MDENAWVKEFAAAVTVCDTEGRILEMNDRSRETYAAEGGAALLGTNLLDCHPEPSRSKLAAMMGERRTNVYTIRKKGRKKLIYQAPWYKDGAYAGFVELSLEVPWDMPHFDRDRKGSNL
ncbi:MAG TPA: PAS domain-containing protein [Candidatus Aminicenantes bacterium]|nr:PAS domain-containing protein [Candidatus Aminicenantes bacterium]